MSKTDATNSKVIRGTPLINSINPTQIIFMTGKFDCLPNANNIPIGKEATIPVTPTMSDKVKPPILSDSTKGKPKGKMASKVLTIGSETKKKNRAVNPKESSPAIT